MPTWLLRSFVFVAGFTSLVPTGPPVHAQQIEPVVVASVQPDAEAPAGDFERKFLRPLREVEVRIRPSADRLPPDDSAAVFQPSQSAPARRPTPRIVKTWQASELVHQPVYFDDVILERYGQTISPRLQPFLSGAHFFGTFPIVPYKMGIDRTHDLISILGYYRPGTPTPRVGRRLPWEADAAFFESGAWLGLIFIFP